MEAGDEELFNRLSAFGCKLPDNLDNLSKLPHHFALPIAQKLLDAIKDEETVVPANKGDQVLLASRIAASCKDYGYEGELGYDLFIYPNEIDLRNVLLFLLSKLSDQKRGSFSEPKESISSLMQNICSKLSEELEKPWFPTYCKIKGFDITHDGIWTRSKCCYNEPMLSKPFKITRDTKSISKAFMEYWKNSVPQIETHDVSMDSETSLNLADDILDKLRTRKAFSSTYYVRDVDEPINEDETKNVEENEAEIENIITEEDIERIDVTVCQNKIEKESIIGNLFANYENNSHKIELLEQRLADQITSLQQQIDDERELLVAKLEKEAAPEVKIMDEHAILENEVRIKTEKLQKAKNNKMYFCVQPDKERLIHTTEIIDTIEQLQKLKTDVSKIISNINSTQKEINNINGVLERSFVVADELIFKDAKKDDFAKKTYKLIANVHTECDELSNMVKEIGVYTRDTVVLEKNVETALRKNTKENLQRATEDLRNLSRKISQ